MSQPPDAPPMTMAERNTDIVAQYLKGNLPSAIGASHGLCAERVRQILRAAGVWKKPVAA